MSIATQTIHTGDGLTYRVTITDDAASAVDLTGATLAAAARLGSAGTPVPGTVTVVDAAGGVVDVNYSGGALSTAGIWQCDLRVTLTGAEPQTVSSILVSVKWSAIG